MNNINENSKYFLFIEPKNKKIKPIDDHITKHAERLYLKKRNTSQRFKGFHTCYCGEKSSAMNYSLHISGKSFIINSLMVHYIKFHRDEVPEFYINLIKNDLLKSI